MKIQAIKEKIFPSITSKIVGRRSDNVEPEIVEISVQGFSSKRKKGKNLSSVFLNRLGNSQLMMIILSM